MSRFSGRVKHSTALWRTFMTSRDSEGRKSHVRRSERPSVVLVLSSVPNVSRQTQMQQCVGLERGPNSDNPSLVVVEWIDAWLSFSNTCKELTGTPSPSWTGSMQMRGEKIILTIMHRH